MRGQQAGLPSSRILSLLVRPDGSVQHLTQEDGLHGQYVRTIHEAAEKGLEMTYLIDSDVPPVITK